MIERHATFRYDFGANQIRPRGTGVGKKGPGKKGPVKTVLGKNGPGKKGSDYDYFRL